MKRTVWMLAAVGLGISLILAVFFSPFASSSPDGLERVAEDRGFLDKAEGAEVWEAAPVPDYAMPGIENESVATGLAGLVGTLATFIVALGVGLLARKKVSSDR